MFLIIVGNGSINYQICFLEYLLVLLCILVSRKTLQRLFHNFVSSEQQKSASRTAEKWTMCCIFRTDWCIFWYPYNLIIYNYWISNKNFWLFISFLVIHWSLTILVTITSIHTRILDITFFASRNTDIDCILIHNF